MPVLCFIAMLGLGWIHRRDAVPVSILRLYIASFAVITVSAVCYVEP